ncbi:acyltransferase [Photobacterium iliopiscarium]|uniref:acyltransferase n=1 Tax=Photobacterium iliopiscarium TaxID=56192 RepID=UPI00243040E0|nr:DapH/DapD/GlmU-related protein [Photobacterium iliopiscarium]
MNYISILRTRVRELIIKLNLYILNHIYKMNISNTSKISLSAKLDKTNPQGIFIGKYSYLSRGVIVLTHDFINRRKVDTVIGDRCFIGVNSIIMPGVCIGDDVIVGAGSIVTKNVPSNSIVAGNPAILIKNNMGLDHYGKYLISRI